MLYNPAKIPAFSRECLARHLAVVVVGFPATPLLLSRARVCISASHSRSDLAAALDVMAEVVDLLGLRYVAGRGRPLPWGAQPPAAPLRVEAAVAGGVEEAAPAASPSRGARGKKKAR